MSDLVPEEAVEQASYRLAGRFRGDEGQWRGYTDAAQVALEAAAPIILAVELERLLEEACGHPPRPGEDPSTAGRLMGLVRRRASVLRGEGDPT